MIERTRHLSALKKLLRQFRVVGVLGARQVGKTTLAANAARSLGRESHWFDLENPQDRARLADPMLTLSGLRGIVVLDEIQRVPELFQVLRVLADRPRLPARFLVLGSASPELLKQSSETLAGRIAYYDLGGFALDEVQAAKLDRLWLRGGFPGSFLTRSDADSLAWRKAFVRTFIERDLPQLGVRIPADQMRRFWTMLAHYHGQVWNAAEFARAFGVAATTVQRHLDTLTHARVLRQLRPWHENLGKRQVKAPKVYVTDAGLLHALLDLRDATALESHPKVGASWEGYAIEQAVAALGATAEECFFWGTHGGAELDLLVLKGGRRIGFECKRSSAPALTPSMRVALSDLRLDRLYVLHAGEHSFPMAERVWAVPVRDIFGKLP